MLPLLDLLTPIINKALDFIPSPEKKLEAQLALQREIDANSQAILNSLVQVDTKQADINIEEAKSSSIFVSGWRPLVGWICAISFAWAYVIRPILCFAFIAFNHPLNIPPVDISEMSGVLTGMLGFGGLRSFEKWKGVAS